MSDLNTQQPAPSKPTLQLHELTSTATDAQIQEILTLSKSIFPPHMFTSPTPQGSFTKWRETLTDPRSQILYVTSSSNPNQPLGYFFNYPRISDNVGFETLHIWLAGITEEARGSGVFPMLIERTKELGRGFGFEYLSIGTFPDTFEKMWKILRANGWEEVVRRQLQHGEHVTLKLKL